MSEYRREPEASLISLWKDASPNPKCSALNAVVVAVLVDLFLLRTQMMTKGIFWLTYTLILPFQLLTNWWLTSRSIVMYSNDQIIGRRLAGAPIEDLLFGFSLILFTLSIWNFLHI